MDDYDPIQGRLTRFKFVSTEGLRILPDCLELRVVSDDGELLTVAAATARRVRAWCLHNRSPGVEFLFGEASDRWYVKGHFWDPKARLMRRRMYLLSRFEPKA